MLTGSGWTAVAGALLLAGGFAGNRAGTPSLAEDGADFPAHRVGSGVVIEGSALGGNDKSILSVLRQRVAGMRISLSGSCPVITMRGNNSIHASPNPVVFVNDTRSANTCILDDLRMRDIERLEVYPTGVGPSPSYGANANGLILVYTRRDEI